MAGCEYVVGFDIERRQMKLCAKKEDIVLQGTPLCDVHSKYTLWPLSEWWKLPY